MNTTLDAQRDATLASIDALSPLDIWAAGKHLLRPLFAVSARARVKG